MSRPKNDDVSSLSHTKWNCLYHIVFTPKYRRKAIYAKLRADITPRNFPEWYAAFDVKETDGMYLPEAERIVIW